MNNNRTPHTDAIIESVRKARGNRPFIVAVAKPANMDFQTNAVATARKVLEGMQAGAPMTRSAHDTMPQLVALMRSFGEEALADSLVAEVVKRDVALITAPLVEG
jgi:hypothetical protein